MVQISETFKRGEALFFLSAVEWSGIKPLTCGLFIMKDFSTTRENGGVGVAGLIQRLELNTCVASKIRVIF